MKGIFFTELIDMAEREYGSQTVEKVISLLDVGENGVFNPSFDYPFEQFFELLKLLSSQVRISSSDISKNFGEYLFSRLVILFRPQFAGNSDIFQFLEKIDYFIHIEMQEVFPHKGISGFRAERISENTFRVCYESKQELIDLAIGLFMGCQKFFNEDLIVNTEIKLNGKENLVCFSLTKTRVLI